MKFSKNRPVRIVMLGCGGTGGHVAPHIYRLLSSLERKTNFIVADGDLVERKNLIRQNFIQPDLGRNKAQVIAERYAGAFGMENEYIPDFIESKEQLSEIMKAIYFKNTKGIPILIGAVDNNKTRKMCNDLFNEMEEIIYIDSGNGEFSGQVVCGVRKKSKTLYEPIGSLYPDILCETDKFPTEMSCAEAAVSAPQSIVANITAATAIVSYIYNILVLGEINTSCVAFSTRTIFTKPTILKK